MTNKEQDNSTDINAGLDAQVVLLTQSITDLATADVVDTTQRAKLVADVTSLLTAWVAKFKAAVIVEFNENPDDNSDLTGKLV